MLTLRLLLHFFFYLWVGNGTSACDAVRSVGRCFLTINPGEKLPSSVSADEYPLEEGLK